MQGPPLMRGRSNSDNNMTYKERKRNNLYFYKRNQI